MTRLCAVLAYTWTLLRFDFALTPLPFHSISIAWKTPILTFSKRFRNFAEAANLTYHILYGILYPQ